MTHIINFILFHVIHFILNKNKIGNIFVGRPHVHLTLSNRDDIWLCHLLLVITFGLALLIYNAVLVITPTLPPPPQRSWEEEESAPIQIYGWGDADWHRGALCGRVKALESPFVSVNWWEFLNLSQNTKKNKLAK